MITKYNYHKTIQDIDIETLPPDFKRDHEYFLEYGEFYEKDLSIRQVINNYLIRLNEYLGHLKSNKEYLIRDFYNQMTQNEIATLQVRGLSKTRQKLADQLNITLDEILEFDERSRPKSRKRTVRENVEQQMSQFNHNYPVPKVSSKKVVRIGEDVKFIKRYIGFHNKLRPLSAVLSFIKSLQRAIVQKLIDKNSTYAKEIMEIQEKAVRDYNFQKHDGQVMIQIKEKDLVHYAEIVGGESVYKSIGLIKRFIGLQGKEIEPKTVESYIKSVQRANITNEDPFYDKVQAIVDFFKERKGSKKVMVTQQELNGIVGSMKNLGCNLGKIYDSGQKELRQCRSKKYSDARKGACSYNGGLSNREKCIEPESPKGIMKLYRNDRLGKLYDTGQKELRQCNSKRYSDAKRGACSYNKGLNRSKSNCKENLNGVMTAEQVANMEYDRLDFTGKYKALLGQPATNFDLMVFGQPGSGKTTFLLGFAHYLALNFGNTLYISGEEYNSAPLTEKVNALPSRPDNLHFVKSIQNAPICDYQFVILDSVTDLGLDLNSYKQLREECSETAFILILQTTKAGNFKGGKEWEHEVEIAGNISNGTVSIYKNRYGVKGTFNFFDNTDLNPNTI